MDRTEDFGEILQQRRLAQEAVVTAACAYAEAEQAVRALGCRDSLAPKYLAACSRWVNADEALLAAVTTLKAIEAAKVSAA